MKTAQGSSDDELVREAVAGSTSAFAVLYDRHAHGVARALASFAGPDRDQLDDLVQDVFLRVVRHLASWQPTHPFTHWLYTIALNVGRNHVRKRGAVTMIDAAILDEVAAPAPRDAIDAVSLMRLVATLPEPLQRVVSLRIGAEMPYGEIAELLGVPEGTARRRMHDAVDRLRESSNRECTSHDGTR